MSESRQLDTPAAIAAALLHQADLPVGVITHDELVVANPSLRALLGLESGLALPVSLDALPAATRKLPSGNAEVVAIEDARGRQHRLRSIPLHDTAHSTLLLGMREVLMPVPQPWLRLAYSDPLTGLANRAALQARLPELLGWARLRGSRCAMHVIDLDHFKAVNDSRGHRVGDAVLREAARRLEQCVAEGDLVARFGGDEFVVLQAELDGEDAPRRVAEAIVQAMGAPVDVEGGAVLVGATIGVAIFPEDADHADLLLQLADEAMSEAKRLGRGRWLRWTGASPHHGVDVAVSRTGVRSFDDEHAEIAGAVHDLAESVTRPQSLGALRGRLTELQARVSRHFEHEDHLMEARGYPAAAEHRAEHHRALAELESLVRSADLHAAVLTMRYLSDWLQEHIESYDMPMGSWALALPPR